jgi:hypothetical protein
MSTQNARFFFSFFAIFPKFLRFQRKYWGGEAKFNVRSAVGAGEAREKRGRLGGS